MILVGAVAGFVEGLRLTGSAVCPPNTSSSLTLDNVSAEQQDLRLRIVDLQTHAGEVLARTAQLEKLVDAAVSKVDLQVAINGAIDAAVTKAVAQAVNPTWERLNEIEERVNDRFSGAERSAEVPAHCMIQDTAQLV